MVFRQSLSRIETHALFLSFGDFSIDALTLGVLYPALGIPRQTGKQSKPAAPLSRCCVPAFKVVKKSGQNFFLHWNSPTTATVTLVLSSPLLKSCSAKILYDPKFLVGGRVPPALTPPKAGPIRLLVDRASADPEQANRDQKAFASASRRPLGFSEGDLVRVSTRYIPSRGPQEMARPLAWEAIGRAPDGLSGNEVVSIVDQQGEGDNARYLVKWKGFADSDAAAEPLSDLDNCAALLRALRAFHNAQIRRQSMYLSNGSKGTRHWLTQRHKRQLDGAGSCTLP
ncbi:hypothetical protein Efla_000508 [Eimeria flavescens]